MEIASPAAHRTIAIEQFDLLHACEAEADGAAVAGSGDLKRHLLLPPTRLKQSQRPFAREFGAFGVVILAAI